MRADVAVIGAGVVGSATALALARRGVAVALLEAGLGFCVKRGEGFIGSEALGQDDDGKRPAPQRRLRCVLLEDPRSVALGNEPVRIGGEIVGRVTTGGFGYTVAKSIAYAYVPPEHAEPGTEVAVEIFGRWVEGEVAAEPLFDSKGERIRADAS